MIENLALFLFFMYLSFNNIKWLIKSAVCRKNSIKIYCGIPGTVERVHPVVLSGNLTATEIEKKDEYTTKCI